MDFKKLQANKIFTGTEILDSNHVLITDKKGVVQEIIPETEAGDDIERIPGILSPGFINCHCHLELSHLKGFIPEKTGLVDFVFNVVTHRDFAEEEILEAIKNAENEMVQNGIVAVGDICNNMSTLPQKLKSNIYYQNFIEVSGWLPGEAETRFNRSKTFYDAFQKQFAATSLVPHAPYSVSDNLWEKIKPYFEKKVITIHNQETAFEDEFFTKGTGDFLRMYKMMNIDNSFYQPSKRSSLQTYFHKLKHASSVILVHNTFTTEKDVEYMKQQNSKFKIRNLDLSWCLCINANQYIEDSLPPVQMLRDNNCTIVLGTDSLASNHTLNILDELKTLDQQYPAIPLTEKLQWATLNGAKALEIDAWYGSFEKGKSPGVIVIENIEANHIHMQSTSRKII